MYNGGKGKKVSKVNMPNKGEINKQRAQCLVEALLRLVDTDQKAIQVTWNSPDTLRVSGATDKRGTTSKDLFELVQQLDSSLFYQVEHVRGAIHLLKGFGILEDLRSASNSPYWKFNLKFNNGSGQDKTLEENLQDLKNYLNENYLNENQLNKSTKPDNQINIKRYRQTGIHFIENLGNGVELEMVLIKGGTFTMGAPETEEGSSDNERPQHEVTLETFFMGKYPITQAQWKAVAALPKVNRDLKENPSYFEGDDRPVECVSWYDAVEFCERLTKHTTRKYSLPSEAQWEYACRAGTNTPFHFGETITSELANYNAMETYGNAPKGKYRNETTPVGSFDAANEFGLYDMHGNVFEWCLDDWHDNYKGAPTDGSAWINENDNISQKNKNTVLRGGSWSYLPVSCRSAFRFINYVVHDFVFGIIAFRVVCGVGRILQ